MAMAKLISHASTLGGIKVATITLTFLDGTQQHFSDVEYVRQPDGCTLVLSPIELVFFPMAALREVHWTLPAQGLA
jgi:hypothetical protein